jgi:hypothetical protein
MPTKIAEGRDAEIFAWDDGLVLRLHRDPNAGARAHRDMAVGATVRSVLPSVPTPAARIVHDGRPGIPEERAPLLREARRLE